MGDVTRLPGGSCRFFRAGRCLYEEELNPGYHAGFRCKVFQGWERAFDDFLRQADAFELSQEAASDIWRSRFQAMAGAGPTCPEFASSPDAPPPGCGHGFGDLCLLALPPCMGRCRQFEPRRPAADKPDGDAP